MGYAFVTQIFPALIMSLLERRAVTKQGAIAGIVAGVATVAVMTARGLTFADLAPGLPFGLSDLNVGVVALTLNVAAMAGVSALTRRPAVRETPA